MEINVGSVFTALIRTLINTTNDIWIFMTQPLFKIDLTVFPSWIAKILFPLMPDFVFERAYDISLIFLCTTLGIVFFLGLKLVTLLNPMG